MVVAKRLTPTPSRSFSLLSDAIPCPSAYVVDGDSINCGSIRLRLLGIDAPELGGCPSWRVCVPGDGKASRRSLAQAVARGRVTYRVVGSDRFGRALVLAWAGGVNLGCWQWRRGQAAYKANWDNGGALARTCR